MIEMANYFSSSVSCCFACLLPKTENERCYSTIKRLKHKEKESTKSKKETVIFLFIFTSSEYCFFFCINYYANS